MKTIKRAIVVGAGIMGIATARALGKKGISTLVLERSPKARGSSIRNFGMVWPIGQAEGKSLEWAEASRAAWLELCAMGGIWHQPSGSVMALRHSLEWNMATEFIENQPFRGLRMLTPDQAIEHAPLLRREGLKGAMYSPGEVIVEAREAIRILPEVLASNYKVEFEFNTQVRECGTGYVVTARGEEISADLIIICNGYDFSSLYPDFFESAPLTHSILQMLRSHPMSMKTLPLSAGLTFLHYPSFARLSELEAYHAYCKIHYPKQIAYGIHLLISQNVEGHLTIGDSHVYGLDTEPFRSEEIDQAILSYLDEITELPEMQIMQRWNGTYAKRTDGSNHVWEEVESGVFVLNGPGGAGMTLSFGMAEDFCASF
jgi:FAD dependent oxidoreductase TIGR03364